MRGNRKRDTGLSEAALAPPRRASFRQPRWCPACESGPISFVSRRVAVFVTAAGTVPLARHTAAVNTTTGFPNWTAKARPQGSEVDRAGWTVVRLWEHVPRRFRDLIRRALGKLALDGRSSQHSVSSPAGGLTRVDRRLQGHRAVENDPQAVGTLNQNRERFSPPETEPSTSRRSTPPVRQIG
jgi:hypothetical protein